MFEFGNGFSGWVIGLLVLLSVLVSWLQYSTLKAIPLKAKILAFTLRIASLLLVIIVISDLRYKKRVFLSDRKEVIVYRDISMSMDSLNLNTDFVTNLVSEITDTYNESISVRVVGFGSSIEESKNVTSFDASDYDLINRFTDFFELVKYHTDTKPDAAIIISDGIQTKGVEPFIDPKKSSPVLSILAGDTTSRVSLTIEDVIYPDEIFANNSFNLRTIINAQMLEGQVVTYEVKNSLDSVLAMDQITIQTEIERNAFINEIQFDENVENEILSITIGNDEVKSTKKVRINVLDNNVRVTQLSFILHPDVAAVSTLLQRMQYIRLQKTFVESSRTMNLQQADSVQLVLVHGNLSQINAVINQNKAVSIIGFLNQSSTAPVSGFLTDFDYSINQRELDDLYQKFPDDLTLLPPIVSYPTISLNQLIITEPKILLTGTIKEIDQQIPLAYYGQSEIYPSKKHIVFTSDKWYRWLNYTDESLNESAQVFFKTLIEWALSSSVNSQIEPIGWPNTWYNYQNYSLKVLTKSQLGELDSNIQLNVQLKDSTGRILSESFAEQSTDEGIKNVSIQTKHPGVYTISLVARKNGQFIEKIEKDILVESSNLELEKKIADPTFLKRWANQSNGRYLGYTNSLSDQNYAPVLATLRELDFDKVKQLEQIRVYRLKDSFWWFILLLITLTAEWLIRRLNKQL